MLVVNLKIIALGRQCELVPLVFVFGGIGEVYPLVE